MLTPDETEALGEETAQIVREATDDVLEVIAGAVAAAIKRGDSYAGLYSSSPDVVRKALERLAKYKPKILASAQREVAEALAKSDSDDLAQIGKTLANLPDNAIEALHVSTASTIQGVLEIVRRDNLKMADAARTSYTATASKYVAMVNAGAMSYEDAVRAATIEMADNGIPVVEYKPTERAARANKPGVSSQADVAIRRHIRTQVVQSGNRRTLQIVQAADHDLVEVSSHIGARPSHRVWQGRVYSLSGADGYENFYEATGYGTVEGLCGAQCKHSFAPTMEGEQQRYSPTPDEDAGLDPEEVYKASQKQRYYERNIRAAKRRCSLLESQGLDNTSERLRLGKLQAKLKEHVANSRYIARTYELERVNEHKGVVTYPLRKANKTVHAKEQQEVRGVTDAQVDDAYTKPLHVTEAKYDAQRRPSRQYVGRDATIAVNPETGDVVSTWPTKSRLRRKYIREGNHGKTDS